MVNGRAQLDNVSLYGTGYLCYNRISSMRTRLGQDRKWSSFSMD